MRKNKIHINQIHERRAGEQRVIVKQGPSAFSQSQSRRLYFLSFCFLSLFSLITFRLFQTMAFSQPKFLDYHHAEAPLQEETIKADIIDRNGHILATSLETASAFIDPRYIYNKEVAAQKISQVLPNTNKAKLLEDLNSDKKFFWLKRNITPEEHYNLNSLGFPGLQFKLGQKRLYPFGRKTAHVIGINDIDGKGLMGVERAFQNKLEKSDKPLQVSLDVRLQHVMHEEISKTIDQFNAAGGAGVIMDAKTGEVLSMVSLPDFNPHHPIQKGKEAVLFNKITQGSFEHGSTFKILNTALALDSGDVKIDDEYDATRPLKVGKYMIKDFYPKSKVMTVPEIFMYSSNIGSVKMTRDVGIEKQKEFFRKLGYLDQMPFDLKENARPITPATWREINGYTISYGYGLSVSPIQFTHGVTTIVNGGYKVQPSIMKQDDPMPVEDCEQVISNQTSKMMRSIMRLSVDIGTSKAARVSGTGLGGKTGTALKANGKSYEQDERVSSFVGAFPIDDPKYVMLVMIDQPKGNQSTYGFATGGWVAAPAAQRIVNKLGPLLDLKPETEVKTETNDLINVLYQQANYRP